ncbi:MAG: ATP-dependent Clp protease ATP-binding subunit [Bacilli bacterium]|nr:ATP-dependent Clp protease ATP-binding subunit [Bacilli bacterium]
MFSKFSEEAQKSLLLAKSEMMKLNHPYVGSEHLLLAILSNENNNVTKKLNKYNITYNRFHEEIIKIMGTGSKPTMWYLYTPLLKRIIQNAIFDTKEKNLKEVTVEQLFVSLLEEGDGVAIRLLVGMNIDIDAIYKDFCNSFIIKKSKKEKKLLVNDFSVNFNKRVVSGEIDPVINRDEEVERVIEILSRRTKNNPLLIGEAGVGKTAIVEELSRRIVEGKVPKFLQNKRILSISIASLVSGTKYRGEFEERINKIIKEVEEESNIILFIDEVHTIVGAGGAEGAIDASNILKPSLARGKIKIIGATTNEEYKQFIEKDKALDRRFQKVFVNEPSVEKTKVMLQSLKPIYEAFHDVIIPDSIIDYIVELSDRYIQNRKNPDKSIDIMDEVCAKAGLIYKDSSSLYAEKNNQIKRIVEEKNRAVQEQDFKKASVLKKEQYRLESELNSHSLKKISKRRNVVITKKMVSKTIEIKTKIPIYEVNAQTKYLLKKLNSNLKSLIIGQDEIIDSLLNYTRRIQFGFGKNKPYSFLLIGSTGTGKTLLAKEYAKELYGEDNFIRVDMSEYKEEYSISKIVGSAPGYVGYDDNITICEKVRNHPNCVLLLDEIEKAHPSVLKLFLQVFDNGIIHDSAGRTISFKNVIIFMTSNIGCSVNPIGFNENSNINQSLKDFLSIEFVNRIDKVFKFKNIDYDVIKKIVIKKLKNTKKQYSKLNLNISFSKNIIDEIIEKSQYKDFGARRVDKIIEDDVEVKIMNNMLENKEGSFTI